MAIKPETEFPGKSNAGDANYPQGSARDITTPGDGTGTPWVANLINDIWGFLQAMLSEASITPSGSPDTVPASDYLDSLKAIVNSGDTQVIEVTGTTGSPAITQSFITANNSSAVWTYTLSDLTGTGIDSTKIREIWVEWSCSNKQVGTTQQNYSQFLAQLPYGGAPEVYEENGMDGNEDAGVRTLRRIRIPINPSQTTVALQLANVSTSGQAPDVNTFTIKAVTQRVTV